MRGSRLCWMDLESINGEAMTHTEAQKVIDAIRGLVDKPAPFEVLAGPGGARLVKAAKAEPPAVGGSPIGLDHPQAFEALYTKIKNRIIDEARIDPILLQILTTRPELVIEVEPRIVTIDGATMRGRVARLLASGWFSDARTTGSTRKELARTGTDPGGGGQLSDILAGFVRDGFLERSGDGYQRAAGCQVSERVLSAV